MAQNSISNISIKEITDDTNIPRINYEGFSYQDTLGSEEIVNGTFDTDSDWNKTQATISNGVANISSDGSYAAIDQSNVSVIGKTYLYSIDVKSIIGTLQIRLGSGTDVDITTVGVKTGYIVANSTTLEIKRKAGAGAINATIDNVSVKEYLGQEVVPNSGCGSWLLEPQSTNLITYSEDFSNSFWLIQNLSVTLNSIISPNGNLNATKLTENTSNSTHRILNSSGLIVSGNVAMSVFAKKGERNWIRLTNNNIRGAFFDLDNGIIGGVSTGITAKIENYGNGWYRCYISQTGVANERLGIYTSIDGVNTTYQGDGTSGVYIYGAQLEQDQSYATSYIPTSGATNTRLQDIATNSGNSTLINSTDGVLYAEIAALSDDLTNRFISLTDGTQNNSVCIFYGGGSSNFIRSEIKSNNVTQAELTTTSYPITNFNKIAVSYAENNFALWVNGIEVATDTSGSTPIGLNNLSFDRENILDFYGKNKALAVYKEALTDANLRCLTYPNPVATTFDLDFDTIAEQFTFTRGSEATFVNAQGLIESTNQLGPELVTNGSFDTNSDWSKGSNWTISGGSANCDGVTATSNLSQVITSFSGKTFLVEGNASNVSQGFAYISLGGTDLQISVNSSGSFKHYVTISSGNSTLFISARSNFIGSIDNVSVKEVISATNTPRIDYSTGAKAFLLEPQRTNRYLNSEDGSSWALNNTTLSSLSGGLNGEYYEITSLGATNYFSVVQSNWINTTAATYTASILAKKGTSDELIMTTRANFGFQNNYSAFDLTNGLVTANSSGVVGSIEPYSDGWYRCSITFTNSGGFTDSASLAFGFNFNSSNTDTLFVACPQSEIGSYATSYIPTSGATATRNQELCNNATPVINSEEGTLYAEISALGLESSSSLGVSDGSGSNRVLILLQSNGDIRGFVASNGVIVFDEIYSGISALNNNKIAISYKLNKFTLWINGVKRFTDTSGNTPIGLSELSFDNGSGASNFFGNTKGLKYYPKALADVQLEDLTTI